MLELRSELRETIISETAKEFQNKGIPDTHPNRYAFYNGLLEAWCEDEEETPVKDLCMLILTNLILEEEEATRLETANQ